MSNPGSNQRVLRLPLSYQTASGLMSVETDDTAFITSTQGFLLFADKGLNQVFTIRKNALCLGPRTQPPMAAHLLGRLTLPPALLRHCDRLRRLRGSFRRPAIRRVLIAASC